MYISDLIIKDKTIVALDELFFEAPVKKAIQQLIKEYSYAEELIKYELPVNNKILLHGASGCGKTATAKAIAATLGKELLVLNLSNVICAKMGETAQNIKMVFDKAAREKSILFLDEFDQIAKMRSLDDKDVGEMRRLVTSVIQLIDYYPQDSILICATNHIDFIDPAIIRRFQLRINYKLPQKEVLDTYYDRLLMRYPEDMQHINRIYQISFAEARDHTLTAVKELLIKQLERAQSLTTI
ncbi:ATP-binding protein [Pedobacter aquatilis]|uniref:AAA family ATPase n=1 Tax=Pedobacter aquatilis TaxID=351343 RepID=UPI00292F2E74|nr:ATP-binding protein [Pedobacter aquatilis]